MENDNGGAFAALRAKERVEVEEGAENADVAAPTADGTATPNAEAMEDDDDEAAEAASAEEEEESAAKEVRKGFCPVANEGVVD